MARTQEREMVTVQMLMFHKRNNAGEVCSFPRQEAEQLISKGIAKLHAVGMVTKSVKEEPGTATEERAAEPKAETPTPETAKEEPGTAKEEEPPKKRRGRKPKATDVTAE